MRTPTRRRCAAVLLVTAISLMGAVSSVALAQGGMGGMGGGMGGMGRGGRGGPPGMGGSRRSPSAMVKENLEKNDPIAFLLDRKKPLTLSDAQKDSLKALRKEMQHMQEPLFKDMDKILAEASPSDGGGMGGMGGRRGGGMGGGMGGGRGAPPSGEDGGAMGPGGPGMPDTVRALVTRLTDIQDAYRDRARLQLNDGQRHTADSLLTEFLEAERKKNEDARAKRRQPD